MLLVWYLVPRLPLGLSTVILSHLLFTLPFVVIVVYARLSSFDFRIVESGARPRRLAGCAPSSTSPCRSSGRW